MSNLTFGYIVRYNYRYKRNVNITTDCAEKKKEKKGIKFATTQN